MIAKTISALALVLSSAAAHAIPMIDFEGFQDGDEVRSCYAGGTSLFGKTCGNYGVTFQGGKIHNNALGGSIMGGFSVSFGAAAIAADRPYFRTTLLATRWDIDGTHSWQLDANGRIVDAIWIAGTANPYCNTAESCAARNSVFYDRDTLFGYEFNVFPEVTRLSFSSHLADELYIDNLDPIANIRWSNAPKAPVDIISGGVAEVPEPAALALMLTGLLWIGRSRLNLSGPPTGGGRYATNHGYGCGDAAPCLPA